MPTIDIFADEAFDAVRLTKRINDVPRVPTKLADLGLFSEEGIATTQIYIEKGTTGLKLVPARARGAPPEPVLGKRPTRIPLQATHLPQRSSVMADEILNIRSFGLIGSTPTQAEDIASVGGLVDKRLKTMRQNLDLTIEWQRIGAIKGQVLDYDGTSVILDLNDAFGTTQQVFAMALGNTGTKVRMQCVAIRRMVEAKLGGLAYSGLRALTSPEFMDLLVGHPAVEKTFDNYQGGAALRNDPSAGSGTFEFGGIVWDEYQGAVVGAEGNAGGPAVRFVEAGVAYVYPTGVSDLFVTTYSPADYVEAVGTNGLPYYAKQRPLDFNKGVEMESQSNPLSICSRPDAVVKVYADVLP